jgi:shikimate dehydrogenase
VSSAEPHVRAAVVGSPVDHSQSPALHLAAYAALGLTGWTYDRIDCAEAGLPALVGSLGPEWVGLSVTMPGKLVALELAETSTARARTVEAANTLVRTASGWHADCTDIDGITGALGELGLGPDRLDGARAVVLGAGGTARAVLVALAAAGVAEVDLAVREPRRAAAAMRCAERAGLRITLVGLDGGELARVCARAVVTVSTVPAAASAALAMAVAASAAVVDVVYQPWPTPIARGVSAAGGTVVGGLAVLLHQAFGQVELFTGRPAPRAAMAAALACGN